jgi:hypothetical protein
MRKIFDMSRSPMPPILHSRSFTSSYATDNVNVIEIDISMQFHVAISGDVNYVDMDEWMFMVL